MRLRDQYKVYASHHLHHIKIPGVTFIPVSVADRDWIKRVAYTINPEIIIYCAGNNKVDWSEINTRDAERLHAGGSANVAMATDILNPKFIFISNSYVFDGRKGNYQDKDVVLPGTALGKAKVAGENYLKGRSLNYIILRSSPAFGRGNGFNNSFLDEIRARLDRGMRIEVPDYEYQSFTPIFGLVDAVAKLVESSIKNRIIHYGGLTKVTLYEFTKIFAKTFGYDESLILPIRIEDTQFSGASEATDGRFDYSLNSTAAMKTLKVKSYLLEEGMELMKQKLVP